MSATPSPARVHRPEVSRLLVAFALLVGMTTWLIHLVGASILVPAACSHGVQWTINLLTAATAVVCAAGIPAGLMILRRFAGGDDARSGGYTILGFVALASNGISLLLILVEGVPNLVLGPC